MKRGALAPPYRATLRYADRRPIDLSEVDHVDFVMRRRGETVPVVEARSAILQDGELNVGVCQYDWQDGDTDLTGIYRAEFVLYDAAGGQLARVPNDSYQEVQVLGNLSEFHDYGADNGTITLEALPRRVNLVLYAGDDFSMTLTVTSDGEPVSLDDLVPRAQVRRSTGSDAILGDFEILTSENQIMLYLPGALSAALPLHCVWDCELTPSGPTLVAGRIRVRPQVSRDVPVEDDELPEDDEPPEDEVPDGGES